MVIEGITLGVGVLVGMGTFLAARRWPLGTEAPVVRAETVEHEVQEHPGWAGFVHRRLNPSETTGVALTVAVAVIVTGLVGLGLLFAMFRTTTGLARWDDAFARFGAEQSSDAATEFLRSVSLMGGTTGVLLVALVVALVEHRRIRNRAVFAFLALAVVGQFLLSNVIKLIVGRARPDLLPLTGFAGESFPSGHASAAAATFMAVALVLGRGRSSTVKALLAGGAGGVAAAVATSRVLLGVHWFTDVLAGTLLGWLWFAVCSVAFGGRPLHFGAPVEIADAEVGRQQAQAIP